MLTPAQVVRLQQLRREIKVSPLVRQYIVKIVKATRHSPLLRFGVSPRGSLQLMAAAQALAALRERDFVLPDDVKYLDNPVLAHRVIVKAEEQMRGTPAEDVIKGIIDSMSVPTGVDR